MSHDRPQLRYVDAVPIEHEKKPLIIIRDPEQLFGEQLAVPLPTFVLMSMFDGERDLRDVQAQIQRQFEQLIPIDMIEGLVKQLDEYYLLDNERSRIRREDLEREYERLDARPAAHAGSAYPADPDELIATFDGYFEGAVAEGAPDEGEGAPAAGDGAPAGGVSVPNRRPVGLVTPHIDIREGGKCMAQAFGLLKCDEPPDCYVILGVAHQETRNLYTLSNKDFETPLGTVKANKAIAERLGELCGADNLRGELAHRFEHSIEFQVIFLKYLHREGHDFTVVPILCGSIDEHLDEENGGPSARAEVQSFCEGLNTVIEEYGPRICVIAGVDLSHVGRKFGDENGVDDMRADLVRAADMRMLECVKTRDAEAFFDHFRPDRNGRNVDAVTAVYSMLRILGPGEADLLGYQQYRERETESMVTFASMALY